MTALQSLPGESLRQRKKRLTHRRICDAAADLFVSQGFSAATVDAIAERAQISKPTFFNYFASKQAVLQELIQVTDNQFVQYIMDELQSQRTTLERLCNLMRRSAGYIQERPDFTRLTLVEGLSSIADQDIARARFQRLHQAMGKLVSAGIRQRDVRSDYSIDLLVQMLVGGYLYALLNWLTNEDKDLTGVMQDTAAFLAEAVAPAK
ncbi:MAG: TetR/AcrR family transcriptional regulator [Gammaproteobacteria bacterium]|uniref:TetR/AcrR family transcriptional regulator n=1 Tax=Pseudomaricurvus alcaniphilus TaxID=1166482 RepID=UPI00140BC2E5|nr:TetR/AcrR family transcriptional regulator [Pseudomaricurvus alcaniphilus]MBR9911096.1 TetR/AcrR family transcriptional regulator [Gammaproteobacteria bacterium]NHN36400.1 TetR/AcrR family transcriptional regulator [Pseudomaricurvus alcaniphilus]